MAQFGFSGNDQASANRLVQRVRGQYLFVPAFGCWWWRMRGNSWQREQARERLRAEYVDMISETGEEVTGRERWQRAAALQYYSQEAVLKLCQEDPRLLGDTTDVMRSYGGFSDWVPDLELSNTFRAYFPKREQTLFSALHAYAHAMFHGTGTLFVRTVRSAADPDALYSLLYDDWGDRVVRLPLHLWSHWPRYLTPEWAQRLWGCWVVFLEPPEERSKKPFPEQPLRRLLLSRPEEEWLGADGCWHTIPLPRFFILGGPPVNPYAWDTALHAATLIAESPFARETP